MRHVGLQFVEDPADARQIAAGTDRRPLHQQAQVDFALLHAALQRILHLPGQLLHARFTFGTRIAARELIHQDQYRHGRDEHGNDHPQRNQRRQIGRGWGFILVQFRQNCDAA